MAKNKTLIFYGNEVQANQVEDDLLNDYLKIDIKNSFEIDLQRSGIDQKSIEIEDDDLIEMKFDDGFIRIMTLEQMEEEFPKESTRGELLKENEIMLPTFMQGDIHTRGLFKNILKKLRIISVKENIAHLGAIALAKKLEDNLQPSEGLYFCSNPNQLGKRYLGDITFSDPILILIHGTASNTQGSFGDFVKNGIPTEAWESIKKKYDTNIFAFEHKSLSKSPLQNALQLLEILPDNTVIHLITQSRGGLVGEILSRNLMGHQNAFSDNDIKIFEDDERTEDVKNIVKINAIFHNKKIQVERFVRVACPVSGTTLASKRLDIYFTVILNLIGLIPVLKLSPIYSYVKSLLIAFVKKRTDITVLPGLESMMPSSPAIKVLNNVNNKISAELFVVSGDVKLHGIGHSIMVMLSDTFFLAQHDFVVNTRSMFGGIKRDQSYYTFYNNKDVSHFNYFVNDESRNKVSLALTYSQLEDTGFKQLLTNFENEKVRGVLNYVDIQEEQHKNTPYVYVIPGIMGSKLKADNKRIWLNPLRIAIGELDLLNIESDNVVPFALMGSAYRSLLKDLRKKYNIVPFPYDWRISVTKSAKLLAEDLKKRLKKTEQPIHIMAHSMAGLVVHALFSDPDNHDLWNKLTSRSGSRIIFLGTPFRGSHDIPNVFLKKNKAFKILHSIDFDHSSNEVLEIIGKYPGMLELLPMDEKDGFNYFDNKVWEKLSISEKNFVGPYKDALKEARHLKKLFNNKPIMGDSIIYVAGKDRCTPHRLTFSENGEEAILMATSHGDGKVPWDTIPNVFKDKTWYMDASHGDLCNSKNDFPALIELLEKGHTQLLENKPIITRGDRSSFRMPEEIALAIHTEDALENTIMGNPSTFSVLEEEGEIEVSVSNGDLGNAKFPIIVGHHFDDAILNAERVVDIYMQNRLSDSHAVGVYPGRIETSSVFLNDKKSKFVGAIVMGLGIYGELNEVKLTDSFSQALVNYAITYIQIQKDSNKTGKTVLGISSLLVGSEYSGLSVKISIRSLLNGVLLANKNLKNLNHEYPIRIGYIELVELYKDKSIQALYTLKNTIAESDLNDNIILKSGYVHQMPGYQSRIQTNNYETWWHRLKVEIDDDNCNDQLEESESNRALKFTSLTDKARAEEKIKATQRALIDNLIESSIKAHSWDQNTASTLFHLMIPNTFKDYAWDNKNVLMILDEETAEYPWEILHAPNKRDNAPLVTQIGFIRQLVMKDYDQKVKPAVENSILVIGNPRITDGNFPNLPGAEKEATTVIDIFKNQSYEVILSIQEGSLDVMNKLFNNDYKVIHLAGHGIVNNKNVIKTGMVLDNEMLITPAEIDSLPYTPEFVFINCCYLGKKVKSPTNFQKLAANVGTQFIKKGVRAVVAAGWAIEDNAAKHFAEKLYANLFRGIPFGDSVKNARSSTHQYYPNNNTWGAYQCYGDPFYQLTKNQNGYFTKKAEFVDILEATNALHNISSKAEPASSRDRNGLNTELIEVLDRIPNDFIDQPEVMEAIANCYYELSDYIKSREYFQKIRSLPNGLSTMDSMRKLASIQTKIAVEKFASNVISKDDANELINDSSEIIENLLRIGKTAGLFTLKGGHYKRKSKIETRFSRIKSDLKTSLEAYRESYKRQMEFNHYAKINYLTMDTINMIYGEKRLASVSETKVLLEILNDTYQHIKKENQSFWDQTYPATIGIYKLLQKTTPKKGHKKIIDKITINYERNWFKGGSYRKSENILGHLDFLINVLKKYLKFNNKETTKRELNRIQGILNSLEIVESNLVKIFAD